MVIVVIMTRSPIYCYNDEITCQPGAKGGALRQTQAMAMMGFHYKHNAARLYPLYIIGTADTALFLQHHRRHHNPHDDHHPTHHESLASNTTTSNISPHKRR